MNNEKKRKTEKAYNKKIKLIIKNFPTKKISGLIPLLVNSTKHLKKLVPFLLKLVQSIEEETVLIHFMSLALS